MEPLIRHATDGDAAAVTEIYNQAVSLRSATADLEPVPVGARRAWLAQHSASGHPVFVAEHRGAVAGWCSLSPYRPGRMALKHTAEISYYVHENFRRLGIGSMLISHVIKQCPQLDFNTLFAIVLDINASSIELLKKHGFHEWGHLPNVAEIDGVECGHLYYGLRV